MTTTEERAVVVVDTARQFETWSLVLDEIIRPLLGEHWSEYTTGQVIERLIAQNTETGLFAVQFAGVAGFLGSIRHFFNGCEHDVKIEHQLVSGGGGVIIAQPTAGYLHQRMTEAEAETAAAKTELQQLTERLAAADRALETFRAQVVNVAAKYAHENDWCSKVSDALEELGLEMPSRKFRATVHLRVRFTATRTDSDFGEITPRWVYNAVRENADVFDADYLLNDEYADDVMVESVSMSSGDVFDIETVDD